MLFADGSFNIQVKDSMKNITGIGAVTSAPYTFTLTYECT